MPALTLTGALQDVLAKAIGAAIAAELQDDEFTAERLAGIVEKTLGDIQNQRVMAVKLTDASGVEQTIQIQDLPVGTIDNIARKHDVSWVMVTDYPLQQTNLGAAIDLIRAAQDQLKIKEPRRLTPRIVLDLFTTVEDDVHHEEGGGSGPLPTSAGDET